MKIKLTEKEEKNFTFLEYVPDSTLLFDAEGKVFFVNKKACQTFGYTPEEFKNLSLDDLIPHKFRDDHENHFSKYLNKPMPREMGSGIDLLALHNNGHEFPVEISLNGINEGGEMFVICSIRDVSKRKKTERELEKSYLELKLIDQITQKSLENVPYQNLSWEILNAHGKLKSTSWSRFYLYNNSLHKLELVSEWFKKGILKQIEKKVGVKTNTIIPKINSKTTFSAVLKKKEVIVLRDKQSIINVIKEHTDNKLLKNLASWGQTFLNIRTFLIIPYIHNEGIFGLMTLSFEKELNDQEINQIKRFNNRVKSTLIKAKIEEENKKLAGIVSISGDAILYTDLKNHIMSWNTGAEKMFGYKKEEIIGESIEKIIPEDRIQEFNDTVEAIHNNNFFDNYETIRRTKKGDRIYVNIAKIPVYDEKGNLQGVWASYRNVSDRKKSLIALRKMANSLMEAQKIARIGNWEWELGTNKVTWSDELYQIFDVEPSEIELSYETYIDLLHPDDQEKTAKIIQQSMETLLPFHTISRRIDKFNRIRYVESRGNVEMDDEKNLIRMYGVCLDITERIEFEKSQKEFTKQLEQKVEERTKELTENRKKLEKALEKEKKLGELKSHFVATVSHQFRTPMAIIQSNSELINMITTNIEFNGNNKLLTATERIRHEITRMTNLMDDVLILGKVTSEKGLKATFSDTDIFTLSQELCNEFNYIQKDGRKVDFNSSGKIQDILIDPSLIRHSLSNLLSNAFKYSNKSNPKFELKFESNRVKIIISDDGIGIPENDLPNLFLAFQRGSNTNGIEGTGLGLAIVKEYLEMNKGKIKVKSEVGKGTAFTVLLPIADI